MRAKETGKREYDLLFTMQSIVGLVIVGFFFAIAPWFGRWYEGPAYADLWRVALYRNLVDFVTRRRSVLYLGKRLIRYCVIASEANQKPDSQTHLPINQ